MFMPKGWSSVAKHSMSQTPPELRALVRRYKHAFLSVVLLSAMLNILLLGGSLYMMMVYDSVLPSHSLPTLFGLLAMLVMIYGFQGAFDTMRTRILGDIANAFDKALSRRVQEAMGDLTLMQGRGAGDGMAFARDLESVRTFLSGSGPATLIDLPWMIFFFAVLTLLHVWLGVTALIGGGLLVCLTVLTNRITKGPTERLAALSTYRNAHAETTLRHVEALTALGMRERMLDRWDALNAHRNAAYHHMARSVAVLGNISKTGRQLLQSLLLTVGAILVIKGEASGGVIFASSVLGGRALAPVDQAIANWRGLAAARLGWRRLCELFVMVPAPRQARAMLPAPAQSLVVDQLFVAPPGQQRITVHNASFALQAGDALAIIGPSAAGKSSLGKALVSAWRPARGAIRLDGATLDQWPSNELGRHLGYLPQAVELMEGTIAENIGRFDPDAAPDAIVAAARAAAVHEMIVGFPEGYETQVGADGGNLSAGQRQRIGLARALYGDPFLVVLDEPNSNLDMDGDNGLSSAIHSVRERGGIVVVIAHRPTVLNSVNAVMVMRDGRIDQFGPREEVLHALLKKPQPVTHEAPEESKKVVNG